MIKKELFNLYDGFHEEKGRIANNEMEIIKKTLLNKGFEKNIRQIQVTIDYENDIFLSDAITVKYEIELDGINIIDQDTVNVLDNYLMKRYGEGSIKVRDIRLHLDYVSFEYLIRINK